MSAVPIPEPQASRGLAEAWGVHEFFTTMGASAVRFSGRKLRFLDTMINPLLILGSIRSHEEHAWGR